MQEQLPMHNVGRIASYVTGVATPKTNKKTSNFGGLFIACCLKELGVSLAETRKNALKNKPIEEKIKMTAAIILKKSVEYRAII